MGRPMKILHIDRSYGVTYLIIQKGTCIRSTVSLERTLTLLKEEEFDLILSEPHELFIIKTSSSGLYQKTA